VVKSVDVKEGDKINAGTLILVLVPNGKETE
jgi:multidrug efflux pump subunit AcrA (membrane-fusion protein)